MNIQRSTETDSMSRLFPFSFRYFFFLRVGFSFIFSNETFENAMNGTCTLCDVALFAFGISVFVFEIFASWTQWNNNGNELNFWGLIQCSAHSVVCMCTVFCLIFRSSKVATAFGVSFHISLHAYTYRMRKNQTLFYTFATNWSVYLLYECKPNQIWIEAFSFFFFFATFSLCVNFTLLIWIYFSFFFLGNV